MPCRPRARRRRTRSPGKYRCLRRLRLVPRPHVSLDTANGDVLRAGLASLRDELEVSTSFPDEVTAEAETSSEAARWPGSMRRTSHCAPSIRPALGTWTRPSTCRVLGMAIGCATRSPTGLRTPGGLVDREAHRRGETLYSTSAFPCIRPSCPSPPPACCPAGSGRRCCGRSISTRRATPRRSTSDDAGCAVAISSTTRRSRR